MVNITVVSPEDLDRVLDSVSKQFPCLEAGELRNGNTLEQAIEIAQSYVDDFRPFTYDDVGLPVSSKVERKAFREWVSNNNIELWHGNMPGTKGFRGMSFRPFKVDALGNKTFAKYSEEVES